MAAFDCTRFVEEHGVVLASGRGPVPSIADAVAGEPIAGSWWAHPAGRRIFAALRSLDDVPDVLCFRLVAGKLTFAHRRVWPALVRLADEIGPERLAAIREVHTESGRHESRSTPFPRWVPPDVLRVASSLDASSALRELGAWALSEPRARTKKRR